MCEICHRLEQPYVKCHVTGDASELAENELLVRWATPADLQARKVAQEERLALEAARQSGLF